MTAGAVLILALLIAFNAVVGTASVAATPLLLVRRLQRMNLPGALRVVE